ncbi:MAG TPA: DUF6249 domain-containing protein [Verrucomicrobiae bacterium]|nr:DUF6249 domain-containing protein [Verrucomicrobiae bacterium]
METQNIVALIPIVAIVMIFGTGMLSIYFNYRKRKDMFALYHQERMAAIDKGIELPPLPEDFFHEEAKPAPRFLQPGLFQRLILLAGLVLLSIGLTLYIALHFTGVRTDSGSDVALYALIPAGIGVAFLVYYFTVGRKLAMAMEEERKARLAEAARVRNIPA